VSYQLGIDLGTTYSAAAVAELDNVQIFQLGTSMASVPSVVLLRKDGTVLTGEAAQRRSLFESGRTAREFKRRLGDPTPYLLGGTPYGVDALTGHLMASVVDRVVAERGHSPSVVVLAHPAVYGPYKLGFLAEAARLAGLGAVEFVPEPVAAAVYYAHTERVATGEMIAVYDFGGGTLDLAVVTRTTAGFAVVGAPEGMERFGGVDLDEVVFGHVDRTLGGIVGRSDPDDATTLAAIGALRVSCREAKEALSVDTDVTIPVMLPNLHTEVRLMRGELEDMIRPRLRETMSALDRTVSSAGVTFDDLSRVLLVGGASRMPLVAEMVRDTTGRPVAVDAHPKHAVALGAALFDPATDTSAGASAGVHPIAAAGPWARASGAMDESPPIEKPASPVTDEPGAPDGSALPKSEEPAAIATDSLQDRAPIGPDPEATSTPDRAPGRPRSRRPLAVAAILAIAAIAIVAGLVWTRGADDSPVVAQPGTTVAEEPATSAIVASPGRVAAVYHVGYRTPDEGETWGDWAAEGRDPPDNLASDFFPILGVYSSIEPPVVQTHFEMMRDSSVGIVAVVWRGPDSLDEPMILPVLDEAARQDRSVAFVLEVPEGKPPDVLRGQVQFLRDSYGEHPALLRPTDPSPWTDGSGMLVMVVGLEVLEATGAPEIDVWRETLDAIHQIDGGATVLAVSRDPMWVADAHFDGLVNGPSENADGIAYSWAADTPEGAWFVPLVSPGWSSDWSGEPEPAIPRDDGGRYLDQWTAATTAPRPPNLVTILSFNDWNAGTQIEPAEPHHERPDGSPYRDYAPLEPHGYLDLTTESVGRWTQP
jgi:molecular chaperone DnaK